MTRMICIPEEVYQAGLELVEAATEVVKHSEPDGEGFIDCDVGSIEAWKDLHISHVYKRGAMNWQHPWDRFKIAVIAYAQARENSPKLEEGKLTLVDEEV